MNRNVNDMKPVRIVSLPPIVYSKGQIGKLSTPFNLRSQPDFFKAFPGESIYLYRRIMYDITKIIQQERTSQSVGVCGEYEKCYNE